MNTIFKGCMKNVSKFTPEFYQRQGYWSLDHKPYDISHTEIGKNQMQAQKYQGKSDNLFTSDPVLIFQTLAKYYASIYSDTNYDDSFPTREVQAEIIYLPFDPSLANENHLFIICLYHSNNFSITKMTLLEWTISTQTCLKTLHPNLASISSLFSMPSSLKIWTLPHEKLSLYSTTPQTKFRSYSFHHPIALAIGLGKLFQKISNKRLFWHLELNNFLQFSFRKGRNISQV